MKSKLLLALIFSGFFLTGSGQQTDLWEKWNWLIGYWIGEGKGEPGQGGGTFSFATDLDKKILVRKSHSEYPAAGERPAVIHNDLMVIYPDLSGSPAKAIYFDNEGHVINYSVTYSGKSIVLTSEKSPDLPVFRLTYSLLENETVNTKFEMSRDGEQFMIYVEGKSKKIK